MMGAPLPLASLSIDVDDLWSYLKTHGDAGWEARPSYLGTFVPRMLDLLDQSGLSATFFLVGVDAAMSRHRDVFREIRVRGHEVGNHSHEHEPWLHSYARARLEREVRSAEDAITAATGERPLGFRGPGYSWSSDLFGILLDRGYRYDGSTLPTYLGPLARTYYFRSAHLTDEQRAERRWLFGEFRDGLRPVKPYRWRLPDGRALLEIPVTTFPVIKTPFHFSYLLYLARRSPRVARAYLHAALRACRLARTGVSFLIHPLDVLDHAQAPELAFFPGMDMPSAQKVDFLAEVLATLRGYFRVVTMGEHALELLSPARSAGVGERAAPRALRTVDLA